MRTLYLCGAGNQEGIRLALVVNRAQANWARIVLLDDDPNKQGQSILGVEIIGPFHLLAQAVDPLEYHAHLCLQTYQRRKTKVCM